MDNPPYPVSSILDKPGDVGLDICFHLPLLTIQTHMFHELVFYRSSLWMPWFHYPEHHWFHLALVDAAVTVVPAPAVVATAVPAVVAPLSCGLVVIQMVAVVLLLMCN